MTHFVYKFFVRIYYQAAFYDVKMIPKLGFVPKLKTILQQQQQQLQHQPKKIERKKQQEIKAIQHGKNVAIAWLFV